MTASSSSAETGQCVSNLLIGGAVEADSMRVWDRLAVVGGIIVVSFSEVR